MKVILNREELTSYLATLNEESKELPNTNVVEISRRLGQLDVIEKLYKFAEDYI